MSLEELIKQRCEYLDLSYDTTRDGFASRIRFGRVMNRPSNATLTEILFLAGRLDMAPIDLVSEYDMGADVLSDLELDLLDQHHLLTYRNEPDNFPHPSPCSPDCPGCATRKRQTSEAVL